MSNSEFTGLKSELEEKYEIARDIISENLDKIKHRKLNSATYRIADKLIETEMMIIGMG